MLLSISLSTKHKQPCYALFERRARECKTGRVVSTRGKETHMGNTKRYLLIKARKQKRWKQVKTAMRIGVDSITLSRWENGKITPRLSVIDKICSVFGMTVSELGLEDIITQDDRTEITPSGESVYINSLTARLFESVVVTIHVAPLALCQLQATITRILEETDLMETNNPNYHITRREAVAFLAALPQITLGTNAGNLIKPSVAEPFLKECAGGITACGTLSNGSYADRLLAYQVLSSYVPALDTLVQHSSYYRSSAALLAYQCLHIKSNLAYSIEGSQQMLIYAGQAVPYAKESEVRTVYISALRNLAMAYSDNHNNSQALLVGRKAAYQLELPGAPVQPLVQSWVHAGLMRYTAGEKASGIEEVRKLAYDTFSQATKSQEEEQPDYTLHSYSNLLRQDAMAHLHMRRPSEALKNFGQILDLNDEQVKPQLAVPPLRYGGTVMEATLASLKVPNSKKDKALSIRLWKAAIQAAKDFHGEERFQEAVQAYSIMESIWPDEADVLDLHDLIVHW